MPRKRYQTVASSLGNAIKAGKYSPGECLPSERELALSFQVSRPTIREALAVLAEQGLLQSKQGAGVFIAPARHEFKTSLIKITEAQRLFESEAAALAAAIAQDDDVDALDRLLTGVVDTVEGQRRFHVATAQLTQNESVIEVVDHLWDERIRLSGGAIAATGGSGTYRSVCLAFRSRDANEARAVVRAQWESAIANLVRIDEAALQAGFLSDLDARRDAVRRRLSV